MTVFNEDKQALPENLIENVSQMEQRPENAEGANDRTIDFVKAFHAFQAQVKERIEKETILIEAQRESTLKKMRAEFREQLLQNSDQYEKTITPEISKERVKFIIDRASY